MKQSKRRVSNIDEGKFGRTEAWHLWRVTDVSLSKVRLRHSAGEMSVDIDRLQRERRKECVV